MSIPLSPLSRFCLNDDFANTPALTGACVLMTVPSAAWFRKLAAAESALVVFCLKFVPDALIVRLWAV